MEKTITSLFSSYEAGTMTRRQVISAILALIAVDTTPVAAAPLAGGALDHLSIQVSDLQRSTRFHRDVLGMTVPPGDRPDGSVRLNLPKGGYLTIRAASPAGKVDHFCVHIEGFDKTAVTRQLTAMGINPVEDSSGAGFHIVDPDGLNVQLL